MADAELVKKLHPVDFLNTFLKENVRPDGRTFLQERTTKITMGPLKTAHGSAMVRIGNTCAICGVKAEVSVPHEQTPSQGVVLPNIEVSHLAMENTEFLKREDVGIHLTSIIQSTLKNDCLDLGKLCIEPGKAVWIFYVDAYILEHDGNTLDAALLACIAAIRNVRLPLVQFDEQTNIVSLVTDSSNTIHVGPSLFRYYPIPLSFALFSLQEEENEDVVVVVDPTFDEETCMNMSIYCIVNHKTMEIVRLQQVPHMHHRYDVNITSSLSKKQSMTKLPSALPVTAKQSSSKNPLPSLKHILERTKLRMQQVVSLLQV